MGYVSLVKPPEDARVVAVPVASSWFIASERSDAFIAVVKKQRRYYIGSVGCGARRQTSIYLDVAMRGGIAVPKLKEPRGTGTGSVIVAKRRLPFTKIQVYRDDVTGMHVYATGYLVIERTGSGEWRPSKREPEYFLAVVVNGFSSRTGCAEIDVEPVRGKVVVVDVVGHCCATYTEAAAIMWVKYPSAVVKKRYNSCAYRGDCVDNEKLVELRLVRDEERGGRVEERDYVEVSDEDIV